MKHKNLEILSRNNNLLIPKFFVYKDKLDDIKSFNSKKIILRSSFIEEDCKNSSFAGIFNSVVVDKNNLDQILQNIKLLKNDANDKLTKLGKKYEGFNIIVQEYIDTDFGGVVFYEKGKIYIEVSCEGAISVVNGKTDETIFIQEKLIIKTGIEVIKKNILKKLLKNVNIIDEMFKFDLDIEFGVSNEKVYIFQVRPITKSIFDTHYILDNSNIGENFPGETKMLTFSFLKNLYSLVYKSTAYKSGISFEKISNLSYIFDELVAYRDNKIYYNLTNWYKMLLLFPGNHKKAFDNMIGTTGNIKYLIIDDMIEYLPKIFYKIKYYLLVFKKIFTFKNGLIALEKYLLNFYKEFSEKNLKEISLEGLYNMQLNFVNNLSYLWFITIDNDFLIMIFSKNNSLQEINGLYSTKQIIYLKKLANNLISLDDYIDVYGHRFGDELKLENDEYDYNCDEFQIILKKYKNLDIKHSKTSNNTLLNFLLNNREKFRIYRSKNFSVARKIFLEIGNRFVEKKIIEKKENIFDFSIEQIGDLISGESKILQKNSIKNLIGNEFEGKIYIMDKFHIPKVDYDIILANNFDPGWTIFLGGLKGIIIENGNLLSHISIISRELKLPLLLGAKGLISVLKNGDYIKVLKDGDVYKKIGEKYEKIG